MRVLTPRVGLNRFALWRQLESSSSVVVNAPGEIPASLSRAKEAARNNDITKAREIYGKVLNEFKGSEAAKRAQARLEELDSELASPPGTDRG
jgi:hypothetical protein